MSERLQAEALTVGATWFLFAASVVGSLILARSLMQHYGRR